MTDNPGDDNDLLNLELGIDTTQADQSLDGIIRRLEILQNVAYDGMEKGAAGAYEFATALGLLKDKTFAVDVNLEALSDQLNQLTVEHQELGLVSAKSFEAILEAIKPASREIAEFDAQLEELSLKLQTSAFGGNLSGRTDSFIDRITAGGGAGPVLPPIEEVTSGRSGSGGRGGSGGSLIGVAFGMQSISSLADMMGADDSVKNTLRAAGDITFLTQAFRDLLKVGPELNAVISATPGLLAPIVTAFTAMGIPLAGLAALVAPLAAALVAVGGALKVWNDGLERGKQVAERAIQATKAYYDAIETETTNSLTKRIEAEKTHHRLLFDEIVDQQKRRDAIAGKAGALWGAEDSGKIAAYDERIKALKKEFEDSTGKLISWERALGSANVALNDAKERIAAFGAGVRDGLGQISQAWDEWQAKITAGTMKGAQAQADQDRQFSADMKMTSEEQRKRLEFLQEEGARLERQAQQYAPYIGQNAELEAAYNDLMATVNNYKNEITFITDVSLPAAEATERYADAVARATGLFGLLGTAIRDFNTDITQLQQDTFNKITEAQAKELRAEQEFTRGSLQDTEARYKIALDASRKETDIREQTVQKIDDIQQKFAYKQSDINTDLSRRLQDDLTKFNNDRAKLLRTAQDQEIEDKIDHERRIAELSGLSALDIEDALLDRNFLEINQQKKHQQEAIQEENNSYAARKAQQQRHLEEQLREIGIGYQQQQQQDRLAAARKLQDAQTAQIREIQQAQQAESRKLATLRASELQQIADLEHTENYKLALLRQKLREQIDLLVQAESIKTTLYQQQLQQVVGQAAGALGRMFLNNPGAVIQAAATPQGISGIAGVLSNLFNTAVKFFDGGGVFGAGEPFVMSENRPEMLNIGAGAYNVGNAAMVIPMQSGSVGRNAGGGNNVTFNIYGAHDVDRVRSVVLDAMEQVMGQ